MKTFSCVASEGKNITEESQRQVLHMIQELGCAPGIQTQRSASRSIGSEGEWIVPPLTGVQSLSFEIGHPVLKRLIRKKGAKLGIQRNPSHDELTMAARGSLTKSREED
jgi:hypothetical protein